MVRSDVPRCGDVYWIDPNPVSGREMKDRHRFVVITPRQINALGVSMTADLLPLSCNTNILPLPPNMPKAHQVTMLRGPRISS